jgi:hypothetical protein
MSPNVFAILNPFRFFPAARAGEWSMILLIKDHKNRGACRFKAYRSLRRSRDLRIGRSFCVYYIIIKKLLASLSGARQPPYFAAFYNGTQPPLQALSSTKSWMAETVEILLR